LIHDADHDVAESAELEEVTQLHSKVKGLENVLLTQVQDQGNTFETVCEKCWKVVVEMIIKVL
jgi:hypothetical protein